MTAQALPPGTDPENALILETTPGQIVIKLRTDVAPGHAERLKKLAREGFYDNVPFHRVIDGFMAQTGDGQHGNGTGGSKHPDLKAEFSEVPFKRGIVGMARKGHSNDSANSQFFIMFDDGFFLNKQYTVIGEVVHGMDVVDKLKRGEPPANPIRSSACGWRPTRSKPGGDLCVCSVCGCPECRRSCRVRHDVCCFGADAAIAMQRAQRSALSSVVLRRFPSRPVPALRPAADRARSAADHRDDRRNAANGNGAEQPELDSIGAMYAALRACWVPPPKDEARHGMEYTVRFAFKRDGEIVAPPRVTYASHDAPADVRDIYRDAVNAALKRCTPLHFTDGMGGAVAGRPIAIRFVDNRAADNAKSLQ